MDGGCERCATDPRSGANYDTCLCVHAEQTRLEFSEWRYFDGCCRRALGEIEGTARRLIETREVATEAVEAEAIEREPNLVDLP